MEGMGAGKVAGTGIGMKMKKDSFFFFEKKKRNDTQPISPEDVVFVNFLAGIRKKSIPATNATVESVT